MAIGNLPDNKLLSLALQGYGPFQPEVGIFCGGYQGVLYPNPTTLVYPGFDPYLHQEITASEFIPNKTYAGLDVGDPGIDYKNPGHILGLIDTFGRMSYGIAVLKAILNENDGTSPIGPAVDVILPMKLQNFDDASIGLADIYPSLSEAPSAYIDHFSIGINGKPSPDPRPAVPFRFLGFPGISPILNPVNSANLQRLFLGKSIFSYFGMPQYFRSVIDSLVTAAAPLDTKTEIGFTLDDDEFFNTYLGTSYFDNVVTGPFIRDTLGTSVFQCKVQSSLQSLKTLTGFPAYHDGTSGQNEYRSLTELNSVVNLVPLQMAGATYWLDITGGTNDKLFQIASYMNVDFVINVSSSLAAGESVTIAGEATVKGLILDPTAHQWEQTRQNLPVPLSLLPFLPPPETIRYGDDESVSKFASIQLSSRNNVSWDKEWLGGSEVNQDVGFSDNIDLSRAGGQDPVKSSVPITVLDTTPLVVPFNQTVTLDKGCTAIRMRAFLRVTHIVSMGAADLWVDEDDWIDVETCHEHPILNPDGPGFIIDFHCHPNIGVLSNFRLGDPLSVRDNLQNEALSLSLNVTGTRLNPILYEISN